MTWPWKKIENRLAAIEEGNDALQQNVAQVLAMISELRQKLSAAVPPPSSADKTPVNPTRRRSWQQVRSDLEKRAKGERDAD